MNRAKGAKGARVFRPDHSAVFLPGGGELARLPRAPGRTRPSRFHEKFEDRALFYDCFWHHDGADILLIGPPPLNLKPHYEAATYSASPSGKKLDANYFTSRSTMTSRLSGVPAGTTHVALEFAGRDYEIAIQPSLVKQLAGNRILFTMNKDNDLGWITDWVHYHVATHRTDTIVLFDNGSTRYGLNELEATLGIIPGLENIVLFSWPYRYGWRDSKVLKHHYWPLFLQISAMSVVLRRLGMDAQAILNCDIDELVAPVANGDVFALANSAPHGVASLGGTWVEAIVQRADHRADLSCRHLDFPFVRRDPTRLLCPRKWVLDPKNDWVGQTDVFPYMHRIMGAPERKVTDRERGSFFHFRGINTGWKDTRRQAKSSFWLTHKRSARLDMVIERLKELRPE